MRGLTGGGTDLRRSKRLPGRDIGTLKTDPKKLFFVQKLGMHFILSYIEFFGSKTIFETYQAVKKRIFHVKKILTNLQFEGLGNICKNVIRKIFSQKDQSNRVQNL